jgi:hypothetical protein
MKKNLELSKVSVDNIKQLQDFIASAKSDADKLKGLKIRFCIGVLQKSYCH